MLSDLVLFYAITPSHVGNGSAMGLIDNPIQRERHTNWPVLPASGFKGALRHTYDKDDSQLADYVFGKADESESYAGAMNVTDVQLLAYPMRSSSSPFIYVTCPAVLKRFVSSLDVVGKDILSDIDLSKLEIGDDEAICLNQNLKEKNVLVEDYFLSIIAEDSDTATEFRKLGNIFEKVIPFSSGKRDPKVYLVSDDVFDYSVSQCTEVNARIKIDPETGSTVKGSLRYQEELPSDCVMYSIVFWGDSFGDSSLKAENVRQAVVSKVPEFIQIGGDMTMGRGLFRIYWSV